MLIKYENILIRNATPNDKSILCKWWNDGNIMKDVGFPNGLGYKVETLANDLTSDSDDKCRRLIIEYLDIPIGEMGYKNKGSKVASIGIKICAYEKRDKGLGTTILQLFIQSIFNDCKFEKIILDTDLNNRRSQHVYKKIGFKRIRINHNSWKNQIGEMVSTVDYELKKEDFLLDLLVKENTLKIKSTAKL